MKILHLLASPAFTGPAETVTQLALAQRRLGHEVTVAVDRKRDRPTSEEPIVPRLIPLGLLDLGGLELSVKSSPWAVARDVLNLRGRQLDVVHSHFSHDHTLARLGRPRGAALIRSIHAPRSVRWAMPAADGFTVPDPQLGRRLLGKRVLVLPAMVDPSFVPADDRVKLRESLGLPNAKKVIGMVSTFQPSRRHELGLDAFAQLHERDPDTAFVLVGDGELEAALKARAKGRVHFAGYQSGAHFVKHLQALDEVWILGLGNDWSARAAAQARACGARVVAVDEGALAHWADAVIEPSVDALVAASEASTRHQVAIETSDAIAKRVLEFYERGP